MRPSKNGFDIRWNRPRGELRFNASGPIAVLAVTLAVLLWIFLSHCKL